MLEQEYKIVMTVDGIFIGEYIYVFPDKESAQQEIRILKQAEGYKRIDMFVDVYNPEDDEN